MPRSSSYAFVFILVLLTLCLVGGGAYATTAADIGVDPAGDPISNTICRVIKIFLGTTGRAVVSIAIFFMAVGAFTGGVDKWRAMLICTCIVGMYGSVALVERWTGRETCVVPEQEQIPEEETTPTEPSTPAGPDDCPVNSMGYVERTSNCPAGQYGQIIEYCLAGQKKWKSKSNECTAAPPVTCDGKKVGETQNYPTYCGETGQSVTYICTSNGTWQPPSGSPTCENPTTANCDGKAPGTIEDTPCPGDMDGNAKRKCRDTGNWEVIDTSQCTPAKKCKSGPGTPGVPAGDYTVNASYVANCQSGSSAFGQIRYTCNNDGTWTAVSCCITQSRFKKCGHNMWQREYYMKSGSYWYAHACKSWEGPYAWTNADEINCLNQGSTYWISPIEGCVPGNQTPACNEPTNYVVPAQ